MVAVDRISWGMLFCMAQVACTSQSPSARNAALGETKCAQYAVEVDNGSPAAISVFAVPAATHTVTGTYLGDVSAGSSQKLTLPTGMSDVRIELQKGQVPVMGDIRRRTTCVSR